MMVRTLLGEADSPHVSAWGENEEIDTTMSAKIRKAASLPSPRRRRWRRTPATNSLINPHIYGTATSDARFSICARSATATCRACTSETSSEYCLKLPSSRTTSWSRRCFDAGSALRRSRNGKKGLASFLRTDVDLLETAAQHHDIGYSPNGNTGLPR